MPDTSTSVADFSSVATLATVDHNRLPGSTTVELDNPVLDVDLLAVDWGSPHVDVHTADNLVSVIAIQAIDQAAQRLGGLPGAAGRFGKVAGGWVQEYEGCDIYCSEGTGAHEVHGDIRAKYNALQGANGVLGLPVTDETGTPDGVGR
jgi:hypothetical protein